jgi:hypothetical protein
MAGFSDFLETKVLGHVFGGAAYTAPGTLHVALYTAAPSDSGGGTEVTGELMLVKLLHLQYLVQLHLILLLSSTQQPQPIMELW